MAQFVLTITSDSAEEIASFLSPNRAVATANPLGPNGQQHQESSISTAPPTSQPVEQPANTSSGKRGRPPKTEVSPPLSSEEQSTTPSLSVEETNPIKTSSSETLAGPVGSAPEVTLADVKTLINQAVKVKPAKAVVDALTANCGTAAPGAMDAAQLVIAKTTLEGLING